MIINDQLLIVFIIALLIRVKPAVSLYMLKQALHYSSYKEAVLGLREFGIIYEVTEEMLRISKEEDFQNLVIQATDGLKSMMDFKRSEKGTKLL